jgi:hypothetical protein
VSDARFVSLGCNGDSPLGGWEPGFAGQGFADGVEVDLAHGTLGGQPHADVEELADAGLGRQEPDDPAQEAPVLHRRPAQPGHQREHLLRGDPVGLEVILAAQILITHWAGNHTRRPSASLGHAVRVQCQASCVADWAWPRVAVGSLAVPDNFIGESNLGDA